MNTIITPTWVTKDVAQFWKNNIKLVGSFTREWNDSWKDKPEGADIGYTVYVRKPQRFVVTEGQAFQPQPLLNETVPLSITHQSQIGMGWSSADDRLLIEEVQERYTMPCGESLASDTDLKAGRETYKQIYYSIGTPGQPLSNQQTWLDGVAKLQNVGVPAPFNAIVDPKTQAKLVGTAIPQFNPKSEVSEYYRTGLFAQEALGISEWAWDQNMPTHTTGTFTASTPLVDGSLQTGSTLVTKGWGTYAFKAGDTFTILGVNAVNPLSYGDTGDLQDFVVVNDLSGSSAATVTIQPSIITSGPLQTVTASPANNAQIFYRGASSAIAGTLAATASRQSFITNEGACAFVMVDLKSNLAGAKVAMARSKSAKLSLRWVEQYNGQTDQNLSRVDALWGTGVILPYFAMRGWS